jgi:FlaA1/EpsC-like NDP-sugar epimerase
VLVGALVAYLARFESVPPGVYAAQALLVVPLLAIVRVVVLHGAGVYRRSWRYTGLEDAIQLGVFHGIVSAVLIVVRFVAPHLLFDITPVPLSVIGIEGLFALGGGAAVRALARTAHERGPKPQDMTVRRALLVGAGREGCYAARGLAARSELGFDVVGFLDDDAGRGEVVGGIEVLGTTDELATIAERTQADLAVLTDAGSSSRALQEFMVRCKQAGISAHTIPALPDLISGRASLAQIRPLDLSELLGRDEVGFCAHSWGRVVRACKGRRVLVTGAGGSIGSELCRQLAELQPERIVLVDNNENNLFDIDNEIRRLGRDIGYACLADIRRRDDLERVFREHEPHLVFHAAAFKHVPMLEFHPSAGVRNNVMGTRLLTEVARRHGVERLVMVSTDKAVRPTNVMGATKQVAEKIVQSTDFACVVRFGNVLGSRGSVFHTFAAQIDRGGPVTVTHPDITRFFMTIPEAVRLVIQATAVSRGGEVFLLEMGEPVQILDLAKQMIELSGASAQDVPIVFTGLRPGEKLHEELLYESEQTLPCEVDGLLVARGEALDANQLGDTIAEIEAAAERGDDFEVREQLAAFTACPVLSHRDRLDKAQ